MSEEQNVSANQQDDQQASPAPQENIPSPYAPFGNAPEAQVPADQQKQVDQAPQGQVANPYAGNPQPQQAAPAQAAGQQPAQPASPYGQPANPYGQPASPYGQPASPYGAGVPNGAVPPAGVPYGYQPNGAGQPAQPYTYPAGNQQPPKKHTGCIIAAVIALLVLVLSAGSFVACAVLFTDYLDEEETTLNEDHFDSDDDTSADQSLRYIFGGDDDATGPITKAELDQWQTQYYGSKEKQGDSYGPGIYYVGTDIEPGTYWIAGKDDDASLYFLLQPKGANWTTDVSNRYFGHNVMEVKAGQVLIVDDEGGFMPIESFKQTFTLPVTNGVYRVGTDIPAGTYYLSAAKADTYFAYYVMDDLTYGPNSVTEEELTYDEDVFAKYKVTVKEGQYLELYNATASTSSSADGVKA